MAIVRFATTCDNCGRRSPEYTAWPACRVCGQDTCPDCFLDETFEDSDGTQTVICAACDDDGR